MNSCGRCGTPLNLDDMTHEITATGSFLNGPLVVCDDCYRSFREWMKGGRNMAMSRSMSKEPFTEDPSMVERMKYIAGVDGAEHLRETCEYWECSSCHRFHDADKEIKLISCSEAMVIDLMAKAYWYGAFEERSKVFRG